MKKIINLGFTGYLICALFVLALFLASCSSYTKYQADWIIVRLEYNDKDILPAVFGRNLDIDVNGYGTTPTMSLEGFKNAKVGFDVGYSFYSEKEQDFVSVIGSKFFTDTFKIECLGEPCCRIRLSNSNKTIEAIYNSDYMSNRRRDCPYAIDVFEW